MTCHVPIIGLGHFQRPLKGLLDLGAKPMLHTVGDKPRGDKKEEDRRHQGETDKGHHQFRPEPCPQNLSLSLKDELHEIADHEKDQEEDQNDVDVDQTEDNNVIGNGNPSHHLRKFHLDGGQHENENRGNPHDDQLITASLRFCGKLFFHPDLISDRSPFHSFCPLRLCRNRR